MKPLALLLVAGVLIVALAWSTGVFGGAEDGPEGGESAKQDGEARAPSDARENKDVRRDTGAPSAAPEPEVPSIGIEYTKQTATVEGLVDYSHNLFVGKVLGASGNEPWSSTIPGDDKPQTQWSVEVLRTYKSSGPKPLREGEKATVNQVGGQDEGGKTYTVQGIWGRGEAGDGDEHEHEQDVVLTDRLLKEGDLYLLATHYDEANSWHAISAQPVGNVSLEGDEGRARRALEMYSEAAKDE
jgi:hypothetical protein